MDESEKEILHAVCDALRNDPALAGYVKSFSVGDEEASRKLFPFISVGNMECRVEPLTIGRGGYDRFWYTLTIHAGTRSLALEEAYAGEHGILQLVEDIVAVIRPNDFGVFERMVEVIDVATAFVEDSGGTDWRGTIPIHGWRRVQRTF